MLAQWQNTHLSGKEASYCWLERFALCSLLKFLPSPKETKAVSASLIHLISLLSVPFSLIHSSGFAVRSESRFLLPFRISILWWNDKLAASKTTTILPYLKGKLLGEWHNEMDNSILSSLTEASPRSACNSGSTTNTSRHAQCLLLSLPGL